MNAHPITTPSSTGLAAAPRSRRVLPRLLALWALAAVLLSASGVLSLSPVATPISILALVAGLVIATRRSPAFRAAVDAADLRTIVLLHGLRALIGVAFLVEAAQGDIAPLFAERAGYGDIAAGVLALLVLPTVARRTPLQRGLLFAWNAFAFLDILTAFATAQYLLVWRGDALMQAAIARFPYPLLPTLVVPWVMLTHLLVFARLREKLG